MCAPIQLDNITILKQGILPKTGGEYALVFLRAEHISHILVLQDACFEALAEDEQVYVNRKSPAFFEEHFKSGNAVLGVVHEGQLVAQSVIVQPTAESPKSGMADMKLAVKPEKTTILQGVIVDVPYQGNRLMSVMVDAWLELAVLGGRTDAVAEVAVGNIYSWSVFMKEGLLIHSVGADPSDGTELYNVHAKVKPLIRRRLKEAFNKVSPKNTVACPKNDLAQQKKLLSEGYKGIKYDPVNDNIVFKVLKRKPKP